MHTPKSLDGSFADAVRAVASTPRALDAQPEAYPAEVARRAYAALASALEGSQPLFIRSCDAAAFPAGRAAWQQWRADVLAISQRMGHLIRAAGHTQGDFLRACGSPD